MKGSKSFASRVAKQVAPGDWNETFQNEKISCWMAIGPVAKICREPVDAKKG